jgi:hypothetical protein
MPQKNKKKNLNCEELKAPILSNSVVSWYRWRLFWAYRINLEVEMAEFLKIAELSAGDVEKIRGLERSTDTHIMAFEPGLQVANLSELHMESVQSLEEELGVILIVYNK